MTVKRNILHKIDPHPILCNIMHKTNPGSSTPLAPQIALVLITMVWGGTFLAVQHALGASTPLFFVGCRFAAAALAVGIFSLRILRGLTWRDVFAGTAIGASIAVGYGAQTIGLQSITSSESAFLTALYVPIVPLLQWLVFRTTPRLMTWLGVALAFLGLVLLTGNGVGAISLNAGQLITILCAIAIAVEIVLIGHFARSVDVRRVTVVQLAAASLIAFAMMPLGGETAIPPFSWTLLLLAGGMGLASALIQLTMNWAQRSVEPSRAAIIYAGEPVWAGLIGRIAGERLPALALAGGVLVVLGVLVSEWRPGAKKRKAAHAS